MLEDLGDDHTNYYPADDYDNFQLLLGGGNAQRFGLLVAPLAREVGMVVLEVFPESPADLAGLKRGDQLLAIDGRYFPVAVGERNSFLKTAEASGESVVLQVKSVAEERRELALQAKEISLERLPSLTFFDEVAYLRIPNFAHFESVSRRVHDLIAELPDNTSKMIIDLRNNPGGMLTECLAASGAFVDSSYRQLTGKLITQTLSYEAGTVFNENTQGQRFELYTLDPASFAGEVVVLVNAQSYSCAEFFSFDLQDRATIIGEVTGGVGNTATLFAPLSNGAGLQITSSQALYRDGSSDPDAVTPDIVLEDDLHALVKGRDAILERALEVLNQP